METKKPVGRQPTYKHAVTGKDLAVRAQLMVTQKILGSSIKEIAEQFQVSKDTVNRALSLARKNDLYGIAEKIVMERLVPKALAVYDLELEAGNLDAARDVAHGTGVLKKNGGITVNAGGGEVTLDLIRARIRAKSASKEENSEGHRPALPEGTVIDVVPEGDERASERDSEGVGE